MPARVNARLGVSPKRATSAYAESLEWYQTRKDRRFSDHHSDSLAAVTGGGFSHPWIASSGCRLA